MIKLFFNCTKSTAQHCLFSIVSMEAEVCKISILRRGEVWGCAVLRACSGTRGGGEDTCFNTQGSLTGIISWSFKILCFIKQFSLDPFYAHLVNSSQLCMQFKLLSWNFYIETYIIWVKFWYMNGHLEIVLCVNQHLNASFNNLQFMHYNIIYRANQ